MIYARVTTYDLLAQPQPDFSSLPAVIEAFISGTPVFDSSCSANAMVTFIDKDQGFFLKTAAKAYGSAYWRFRGNTKTKK